MSIIDKYNEWNGRMASGNAKDAGQAATNFFRDDFVNGFTVNAQQGSTDIKTGRVESRDVPSLGIPKGKSVYDDATVYSDSITNK